MRALVLVLTLLAAGLALAPSPASADASPVVVQLATHLRATPRLVSLRGETSDGHLLFFRGSDPAGRRHNTAAIRDR